MRKNKLLTIAVGALSLLSISAYGVEQAFAYTVNNGLSAYGYVVKNAGSYMLMGGDGVKIGNSGPYSTLYGQTIHISQEQANAGDGQGSWGVMLGDMQGANANNGYLLIADDSMGSTNVDDWVNRLGGNLAYVKNYLQTQNQQINTYDNANQQNYTYDPFASVVTESGAKFGTKTATATGQDYNGNPIYVYNYPIQPSNPPSATSLKVTDEYTGSSTITPGDPISISASSNIPLWSGFAAYHYDAIEFTNTSTGQSTWATFSGAGSDINVTDNGQTINNMVPESGGSGSQSDSITDNADSSLAAGTYTAKFWVSDGVHRLCATPATANFTIGAGSGPSVTLTANPIQLPTGQSSTLTATATGMSSEYALEIVDQSGDNTLGGQNTYQDFNPGETGLSTTATDNNAQSVTYVAEVINTGTLQVAATSTPVTVTWGNAGGGGATISLTANPTSLQTGNQSTISYSVTGWSYGDYVTVTGTGGSNMWSDPHDGNANDSYSETENPQNGATTTVKYTAILYNSQGVAQNASSVTITWSSTARPATTSLDLSANPTTLQVGASTTFTVTIPPDPDGGAAPSGEFVQIYNADTGQFVGMGEYTGSGSITYGYTGSGETESFTTTYSSNTGGPQNFVAKLWGPGVTPWNNPPQLTSNEVTVTWVKPTVTLYANPQNPASGQSSQISYNTVGFSTGDTVTVTGSGGSNMWNVTNDTQASDSFTETENPANGNSTSVQYTAVLKDNTGTILSTSYLTVTWTSPTISMGANPQRMVPGQSSTISYNAQNLAPNDYVDVVSTGGANGWNVSNQTQASETYQETENPAAGQTVTVNYTATIYNSLGQALAQATTSAVWTNAWSGTINLSANPQFLATGSATNLTATTTQSIPTGYSLTIMDNTTGQIVATTGTSPLNEQYTSYKSETDQFIAYINDGYEDVGNQSNTVNVTWSELALNANPIQLPANQNTTLTVTGQNVPSGDYLVLEDMTTGQIVGSSQSVPYTVTQTKSAAETDVYEAFINSSPTPTGAYATSNQVTVYWYSVTLTVDKAKLQVGQTATLTATAQNIPSGYVLDIVDETTNTLVASGLPGETTLNGLQTKNQVETDQYIAQIVQPNNPPIPGLSVPASAPPDGLFNVTSTEVQHYDPSTNSFQNIAGLPIQSGTTVTSGSYITGPVGQAEFDYGVYDPNNQTVYAIELYSVNANNETYFNYEVFGYNLNTDTWSPVQYIEQNYLYGFFETEYFPDQMFYNPNDHNIYILYSQIDMYGDCTFALDIVNPATTNLSSPLTQAGVYSYTYWDQSARHGNGRWITEDWWPYNSVNLDPTTGNLYYTGYEWDPGNYQYANEVLGTYLMEYNDATGQTEKLPASMDQSAYMGIGAAYDPQNGLIYFGGFQLTQSAPFYNYDRLYSFNLATNQTTDLGPMPDYTPGVVNPAVNYVNGHIFVSDGSTYEYNPDTNTYTSAPFEQAVVDTGLNQYVVPGSNFYDSNLNLVNAASNDGGQLSYGLASGGPTSNIKYFPYWTFQAMPSYIPLSLFPTQAVSSGGGFWTQSGNALNGTAFFESQFNLPSTEQVTLQIPSTADDFESVYVDGQPVLQNGLSLGTIPGQPGAYSDSSATITLPAGLHQVVIEGVNTNGFGSTAPNPAAVSLQVLNSSNQVLIPDNPSSWMTTGYVSQLPAGWFSGAIGSYNFTEYILQESGGSPVYQQQNYNVTTTGQNVAEQSAPVNVQWMNLIAPPDNPTLTALPTNVVKPAPTQFLVNFDQSDANFVNQELGGSAPVQIYNAFTWRPVATGTWSPSNGMSLTIPYNPVPGGSSQYLAFLEDTNKHPLAVSNQVTVTDTGNGKLGNSYSELVCGPKGDGTEIFQNYQNGKLVSSRTVPLTITNLNINGIFNPTQQLKDEYPGNSIKLPITNAELSYGPIPLRVQAPFGFAVQFPDAQPTQVTATFTVNEGYAVDMQGDTSWTVSMKPAQNQPLYWQGATIMPKLPDGVHIMVKIVAQDDCGTNTLVNNDFVTTAGRPQWYFVQPTKPGN